MSIRPQYHFRRTDTGLDAFNVSALIRLSRELPTISVDPRSIAELGVNHWYMEPSQQPTPRSMLEHIQLVEECDLSYPIILDSAGRVMDGMHRICRAIRDGHASINAKQFVRDPTPDFINCAPEDLPYTNALFDL
jgi:hypothetical protein